MADRLSFTVRGETVSLSFQESQTQIPHIATREENIKLLEDKEAQRKNSYADKPNICKYDYAFNGKLSVGISTGRSFRGCNSYQLEDKLGDMVIGLYVASEPLIQKRLAREEVERQRQEEEKRREERRKCYNEEVARTVALRHKAEDYDYDIACKIRAYIAAVEAASPTDDAALQWLLWAKQKADWYDSTVKSEDAFFDVREHGGTAEQKKPREKNSYGFRW